MHFLCSPFYEYKKCMSVCLCIYTVQSRHAYGGGGDILVEVVMVLVAEREPVRTLLCNTVLCGQCC